MKPLVIGFGFTDSVAPSSRSPFLSASLVDQSVLTLWMLELPRGFLGSALLASRAPPWGPLARGSEMLSAVPSVGVLYVIAIEIGPSGSIERSYPVLGTCYEGIRDGTTNLEKENVSSWKHECVTGCSRDRA